MCTVLDWTLDLWDMASTCSASPIRILQPPTVMQVGAARGCTVFHGMRLPARIAGPGAHVNDVTQEPAGCGSFTWSRQHIHTLCTVAGVTVDITVAKHRPTPFPAVSEVGHVLGDRQCVGIKVEIMMYIGS